MWYTDIGDSMNNIPLFLGQSGTATLILREIPVSGRAYILLRTVQPGCLCQLLAECRDFCVQWGAKRCFAAREGTSLPLPHAYDILKMTARKELLPSPPGIELIPLCPDNEKDYGRIYNRCFLHVSHAGSYDRKQLQRIYAQEQQAFLAPEPDGSFYGIGELHGNELAAVGVLPEHRGKGTALTLELLSRCPGPELSLTVASDNEKALRLYRKLGFSVSETESSWFELS